MKPLLLALLLWLPGVAVAGDWEPAQWIPLTPWYRGRLAMAETKRGLLDFNGGPPPRDVRLKGNGWFASVSREDCGRVADTLISRIDQVYQYRLEGQAFDGLPRYFAHKRFFLASIDPPVLLVVPHTYRLKYPTASIKNPYLRDNFISDFNDLYAVERAAGQASLLANATNWFNYVELKAVFPDVEGIEVVTERWSRPLQDARDMPDWPFDIVPSMRFAGQLELVLRASTVAPRSTE